MKPELTLQFRDLRVNRDCRDLRVTLDLRVQQAQILPSKGREAFKVFRASKVFKESKAIRACRAFKALRVQLV